MKKISFAIGIHNHQPVGNPPEIVESCYRKAYLPFIEVLERHERIKIALHYSGALLDFLTAMHPEFIEKVRKLVSKGQVEIMTGGYYEPIFAVIPDRDKAGQIKRLTGALELNLGLRARGMWLAERVWEPHLAKHLGDAGVDYTVLDDSIFTAAGMKLEDIYGYYITEEQGSKLRVFPISKRLRYLIPFEKPELTVEFLKRNAAHGEERLVVIADDGEKFGVWPDTYNLVYRKRWLDRFFRLLEKNSDWINLVTFSEHMDRAPPRDRIYLPAASYSEMMEWALPVNTAIAYEELLKEVGKLKKAGRYEQFLKGGFWRNFLAKYEESNNLHKKMLLVSEKVAKLRESERAEAEADLYRGQCNDAYWHGVFGGLYLAHLRCAIYQHLIRAEKIADQKLFGKKRWLEVRELDFDSNGFEEILVNTDQLNIYIDPHKGGSIFELDYKVKCLNLMDTLTRRKEAYHRKLLDASRETGDKKSAKSIHEIIRVKEAGLQRFLKYDSYRRASLIDHFLPLSCNCKAFAGLRYEELGEFVEKPYKSRIKASGKIADILLERRGLVKTDNRNAEICVAKQIRVESGSTEVLFAYTVQNQGRQSIEAKFGVEFNFSRLDNLADDKKQIVFINSQDFSTDITQAKKGVRNAGIKDDRHCFKISMQFEKPCEIWHFPIEAVSQSESGFELTSQGIALLPCWKLSLDGSEKWSIKILKKLIDM